jgi:aspartyl-tRNA(Asn)/glutamyl-tRNA(Gln) amidotransferase subunit A
VDTSLPSTISGAAAALRDGSITSTDLVRAMFRRAGELDAPLGSYITRFDEHALDAAARADADLAAGTDRGALHGIPIALKDNILAREGPTTAQSMSLDPDFGRGVDAEVTKRLRAAGAIIMGKTSLSEFATGSSDPQSPFPLALNPWNLSRSPGGSSSGSGNGVAAGLFLGALGTDTGGSVRLPAHFNGITGHRPTFGLVPVDGTVALADTFDCVGPMARSARDCAIMLTSMTDSSVNYEEALNGSLQGVRLGVYRPYSEPLQFADEDVIAAFERAVVDLAHAGAVLTDLKLPWLNELTDAYMLAYVVEILANHQKRARERWTRYGARTRLVVAAGALHTGNDYLQAQRLCRFGLDRMANVFEDVDVIVLPTAGVPAPGFSTTSPKGGLTARVLSIMYTMYVSALRVPAVSAPMGLTSDGLPCGLQIVGRRLDDATVLRVADAYQRLTDWHLAEPPMTGEPAEDLPFQPSSEPPDPEDETTVRHMIALAGLPASDVEIAELALNYPSFREAAESVGAAALGELTC